MKDNNIRKAAMIIYIYLLSIGSICCRKYEC